MKFRNFNATFLASAFFCAAAFLSPTTTSFAQDEIAQTKEELLAKKAELLELMTAQQRLEYARAEELVESGKSDERRGQFLANRQPSRLNPNEDLKEDHARGKLLIRDGRIKARKGEQQILLLLREAESTRLANKKPDKQVYKSSVSPSQTYESALDSSARDVLKACWDQGYTRIFYDRVYQISDEGTVSADPKTRNKTYDVLIRIDGTRFSVVMPVDLKLDIGGKESARQLNFENRDSFSGERIALLSIQEITFTDEFFGPFEIEEELTEATTETALETASTETTADGAEASEMATESENEVSSEPIKLLVLQAIDANTLQLIEQELRWIVPKNAVVPRSAIKDKFELTELKQTIQLLASLPEPYEFRIHTQQPDPLRAAMLESYLLEILESNFDLKLVPLLSLQRLVSEEDAQPDFQTLANASLILEANGESPAILDLSAAADSSDRSIALGRIEISKD